MKRRAILLWTIRTLCLLAICASVYLGYVTLNSAPVIGCDGGAADCGSVISSRWAKWFGVPVSFLGLLAYVMMLTVSFLLPPPEEQEEKRVAWVALVSCVLSAVGAGAWFVGLQFVSVGSICTWCMAVHFCGLVIALCVAGLFFISGNVAIEGPAVFGGEMVESRGGRPLSSAGLGVAMGVSGCCLAVLIVGQLLTKEEDTFGSELLKLDASAGSPAVAQDTAPLATDSVAGHASQDAASERDSETVVSQDAGPDAVTESDDAGRSSASRDRTRKSRLLRIRTLDDTIDTYAEPIIGDPEAPEVFVEFVDYTCDHCRILSKYMKVAVEKHPDKLAVVVRPCALNRNCNKHVVIPPPHAKRFACDYAKLAIAVWMRCPERFLEFHEWLMEGDEPPTSRKAKDRAVELCGGFEVLTDDFEGDRVARALEDNNDVFDANSNGQGLPMIFTPVVSLSGAPQSEERFLRVVQQVLDASLQQSTAAVPGDGASGSGGGQEDLDTEFDESLFE